MEIWRSGADHWEVGPPLPERTEGAKIVEDRKWQNGSIVITGIGNSVYKLDWNLQEWTTFDVTWPQKRFDSVAFFLPDEFVECN